MAKRRNYKKTNIIDSIMIILMMPIVLLAAFPILWIPVGILILCWSAKKIFEIIKTIRDLFPEKKEEKSISILDESKVVSKSKQVEILPQLIETPKEEVLETPYDKLFEKKIIYRGRNYYLEGNITNFNYNNSECNAVVLGTSEYQVNIKFGKNNIFNQANCTCPYYQENHLCCKHIYATLLKYCERKKTTTNIAQSKYGLLEQILEYCDKIETLIDEVESEYISFEIENEDLESLYYEVIEYRDNIDSYRNKKISEVDIYLIEILKEAYQTCEELHYQFMDLCEEIQQRALEEDDEETAAALMMGAVAYNMYKNYKEEQEEIERLEEREFLKNEWGLTDYQVDLVESGEYEPSQFSEEDYYEDDNDF